MYDASVYTDELAQYTFDNHTYEPPANEKWSISVSLFKIQTDKINPSVPQAEFVAAFVGTNEDIFIQIQPCVYCQPVPFLGK